NSDEMTEAFAEWPEAIASTREIAERCNVDIELGRRLLPTFATPDGRVEGDYLRDLAHEGLRRRYGDPPPAEALERLEMELGVIDRLAKMIPDAIQGRPPSFDDCLKEGEELAVAYRDDEQARKIIDVARGLEGIVRNAGIHAAGVVISDRPLTEIVPVQLAED